MPKRINSRSKGGRGERAALRLVEKWWNPNGVEDKKFFRTPGSGGLHTQGFRFQGVDISGDISTPDPGWPFSVEVKNCEGWHLEQLLTAPKNDIYGWWKQATEQTPTHLKPLLLFKRNHHAFLFMMRRADFFLDLPTPSVILHLENEDVVIGLAEDLFASDPDRWRKHKYDQSDIQ